MKMFAASNCVVHRRMTRLVLLLIISCYCTLYCLYHLKESIEPSPSILNSNGDENTLHNNFNKICDWYESGFLEANINLCGSNASKHIRLLILITSAPMNRDQRLAIRQIWSDYASQCDIVIAFVLGATNYQSVEDMLDIESNMYNDIIRGRFMDSYNNLTLKSIKMLEWMDTYCSHAKYVLKTDDDMFINIPRLLSFIDEHHSEKQEKVIYGRLARRWPPNRDPTHKNYMSSEEFPPLVFPDFTTGGAYLITRWAVHDLYIKALEQRFIKCEDVFITGIVAELANVTRIHGIGFTNLPILYPLHKIQQVISIHGVEPNQYFDLWKTVMDTDKKC